VNRSRPASPRSPRTKALALLCGLACAVGGCDAVVIAVTNVITVSIALSGTNVNLSWTGGVAPYVVQRAGTLPAATWSDLVTTSGNSTNLPVTNTNGFFRVKGQ